MNGLAIFFSRCGGKQLVKICLGKNMLARVQRHPTDIGAHYNAEAPDTSPCRLRDVDIQR